MNVKLEGEEKILFHVNSYESAHLTGFQNIIVQKIKLLVLIINLMETF